jgi:hypothetical protein
MKDGKSDCWYGRNVSACERERNQSRRRQLGQPLHQSLKVSVRIVHFFVVQTGVTCRTSQTVELGPTCSSALKLNTVSQSLSESVRRRLCETLHQDTVASYDDLLRGYVVRING